MTASLSPVCPSGFSTRGTWRQTFRNETAAEQYLAERSFSVGRRQGGAERGILLGSFDIQKWRNLTRSDRAELHGVLQRTGFDRDAPAVVTIFAAAPYAAHAAIRSAAATQSTCPWQPIETAPTKEDAPFLVMTPGNGVARFLILQVTRFEGELYPDHLDGAVSYSDRVTNATLWMPAPEVPDAAEKMLPVAAAGVAS